MNNQIFEKLKAKMSLAELARRLEVQPMLVSNWKKRGVIPAERVLSIEEVTGVSRHDLRPDIYPLDDKYKASEDEDAA
jgi:DNA-binding transcriptional regulator YdaS (Cro superfamily)